MTPQLPSYAEENAFVHSSRIQRVPGTKRPRSFPTDSLRHTVKMYRRDNLRWVKWWLSLHRTTEMRRSLKSVQNAYAGRPALVMGNGPSTSALHSSDISAFVANGGHLFTVNHVFEHGRLQLQQIFCHTLSDPKSIDHVRTPGSPMSKFFASTEINYLSVPDCQSNRHRQLLPSQHILPFCDSEIRTAGWKKSRSIRPDRPRSYLSLTVYKALALAIWMGHDPIYIVGIDNTYVRDLYCGPNNEIILRQRHFYGESQPGDYSLLYASVGDLVYELAMAFSDLDKFSAENIINLDPFSLTDAFRKVPTLKHASEVLTSVRT